MKILLAGLDSVGKTSIVRKIFADFEIEDLTNMKPTRNYENMVVSFGDTRKLGIWDLGGQIAYRASHSNNPRLLSGTSTLIYVVDVQDDARLLESYEYFKQLVSIFLKMDLRIEIFILMHKYDPDIQIELKWRIFEIRRLFNRISKIYRGKISYYPTSIYSESLEYTFAKIIKLLDLPLDVYQESEITTNVYLKEKGEINEVDEILFLDEIDDQESRDEIKATIDFLHQFLNFKKDGPKSDQNLISQFNVFYEKVMELWKNPPANVSGDELLLHNMDSLMRFTAKYCTDLIYYGFEKKLVTENQLKITALIFGQINFMKVHFIHFIDNMENYQKITKIKFYQYLKKLIGELPLMGYLADGIDIQQFSIIQSIFSGNPSEFTLFPVELEEHIYSFHNIGDLHALVDKKKSDLLEIMNTVTFTIEETKRLVKFTVEGVEGDFKLLHRFIDRFDYMRLEFYYLIRNLKLNEHYIREYLTSHMDTVVQSLLRTAKYLEIFSVDEKNQLMIELNQI